MTDLSPALSRIVDTVLLPVTLCFIAGATLAGLCPPSWQLPLPDSILPFFLCALFGLFLLIYGVRWYGSRHRRTIFFTTTPKSNENQAVRQRATITLLFLLFVFFGVVGFVHTWLALQPPTDPTHIYSLVTQKTQLTLEGRVTGLVIRSEKKSSFVLEVSRLLFRNSTGTGTMRPAKGKVRLSMRGNIPDSVFPGQTILAVASVDRIHNYQTPGTFNYVLYMRNKGIYCSGWIKSSRHILIMPAISPKNAAGMALIAQQTRQHIRHFLGQHCDPKSNGLYQALLIGDRSGLDRETLDHFALTGCMHLLAISGLHMGLLAFFLYGIVYWLLKRFQWLLLHTNVAGLALSLTFPFLLIYAFIAGMNAPVFRALVMAAFFLFATLLYRQHNLFHLLAIAALVLLTLHPLALYTVSFQLSFAALIAIALFVPSIRQLYTSLNRAGKTRKSSALFRWSLTAFFISLAATAGTLPLLLYHFNRFSPIGPLMNLLVEPLLCFIALPLGLIAMPLLVIAPGIASALLSLGGHALHAADFLTTWASRLSWASLWTITPTTAEILVYYLLFTVAGHWTKTTGKTRVLLLAGCILLGFHFTRGMYLPDNDLYRQGKRTRVSFLDVGKGSATFLEFADGRNMLIDGGGSSSANFNVGRQIIAPFLWQKRVWRVDSLIITHPDSDHYNGLDFIVRRFRPHTVYINDQPIHSKSYAALLTTITQQHIPITTPDPGQILHADSLCRLTCLGMVGLTEAGDSDNNQGLVTRMRCNKISFLFPADIERHAESLLLRQNKQMRTDVLMAPHHGSKTSCSHPFLRAVAPKLIIVSAGRRQQKYFPSPVHRKWWQQQHIPMLITGINGTVACTTDGKILSTKTWMRGFDWDSKEIRE